MSVFGHYQAIPADKLVTPEDVARAVNPGDNIMYGGNATSCGIYLNAIAARVQGDPQFRKNPATVSCVLTFEHPSVPDRWNSHDVAPFLQTRVYFTGPNTRDGVNGTSDTPPWMKYVPLSLSHIPHDLAERGVDIALLHTTPPRLVATLADTCVSKGLEGGLLQVPAEKVFCLCNPRMPFTMGRWGEHMSLIPMRQVTGCTPIDLPLITHGTGAITENHRAMARFVFKRWFSGDHVRRTIQVGLGEPDAVIRALADLIEERLRREPNWDIKVWVRSEMGSDWILRFLELGIVQTPIVVGFLLGSKQLYDIVDGDERFQVRDVAEVNDPTGEATHKAEGLFSGNAAIIATLSGETIAYEISSQKPGRGIVRRRISGPGGNFEFPYAASHSADGKGVGVIFLPSQRLINGVPTGSIVADRPPYTRTSIVAAEAPYFCTEYGLTRAPLARMSDEEKALALISIAHPDDRPALFSEASRWYSFSSAERSLFS